MNGFNILRLGVVVVMTVAGPLFAAEPAGNRQRDEAAVRQAGRDYLAAIERGDLKAAVESWTAEGTYTDDTGQTIKIRDLSAKKGAAELAARRPINVRNVAIRFLTGDVAVEDGECEAAGAAGQSKIFFSAMWVRQDGRWKLDTLRETRAAPAVAEPRAALAPLEVLVGEWSGTVNLSTLHVSATWNETKTFLRRELWMDVNGKRTPVGTQFIGWDPVTARIKSWFFNEDGSHGDGLWTLEGNVWMVSSSRMLPDGKSSEATQIYKFRDKDTMLWKLIRGSVGGQAVPDLQVEFKRTQPGK